MRLKVFFLISIIFISLICISEKIAGCTSAVINCEASHNGIAILWKNRDTNFLSNKIIYVEDVSYSYVGIINASETYGRFVYAGLNSEGFALLY